MEVTALAVSFALLGFLVWSSKRINRYSEAHYGYTPIGLGTLFLAMIPYVLLIVGFFFFREDPSNQTMAIVLGVASAIGLFWWIESHSSFLVVLGSIIILPIAGITMFAVILPASGRDNSYYYDD
jgi:drug/metabolite transporter (DMT)-like permease